MARKGVHHRQLMIEAPAGEAHGDHHRGADMAQRLVEIGGVLLFNPVEPVAQPGPQVVRQAVEIADHRLGMQALGHQRPGPAIHRHGHWCQT